jgi:malate dehydrogenase (oxaloacetate-decarboxylating)(NADP+)
MDTGVARVKLKDLEAYRNHLEGLLGKARELMREIINRARTSPRRIVFPEGDHEKILRALPLIMEEEIARPIILGPRSLIEETLRSLGLPPLGEGVVIADPVEHPSFERYVQEYYRMRQRKGVTPEGARRLMRNRTVFAAMMVHMGDADGLVAGVSQNYADTIRPALQVIKVDEGVRKVSGLFMMVLKGRVLFFADTTVNIEPSADDLAETALNAARFVRRFGFEPRVAMLSFSNFGSVRHPFAEKVRRAVETVKKIDPALAVDGEMQVDPAVLTDLLARRFPFSDLQGAANILIFPDLQSANISYKLLHRLGGAEAIGPILLGMSRPVHILQRDCEVQDVVNMTAIAVLDAIGH